MAGRKAAHYAGLEIGVSPAFWLRRWLRFPFYFDSTNPSFRIDIECHAEPVKGQEWKPGEQLDFEVVFADTSSVELLFPNPLLKPGERTTLVIPHIYSPRLGQTEIRMPIGIPGGKKDWHPLYSYQVRSEEQLWLAVVGPLIGAATSAAIAFAGFALAKLI